MRFSQALMVASAGVAGVLGALLPTILMTPEQWDKPEWQVHACACGGNDLVFKGWTGTYRCCSESGGKFSDELDSGGFCDEANENEFTQCCTRLGGGPGTGPHDPCVERKYYWLRGAKPVFKSG
jgi:hypothetical protein